MDLPLIGVFFTGQRFSFSVSFFTDDIIDTSGSMSGDSLLWCCELRPRRMIISRLGFFFGEPNLFLDWTWCEGRGQQHTYRYYIQNLIPASGGWFPSFNASSAQRPITTSKDDIKMRMGRGVGE